jgi:putative DNA primase/helicase
MKTVEAAKGHWAMIFEHYGLPPITGKNHFKGSARCVIRLESSASMTATAREHGSAPAAAVTGMKLVTETQGKPFNEVCREIDALIGNTFT